MQNLLTTIWGESLAAKTASDFSAVSSSPAVGSSLLSSSLWSSSGLECLRLVLLFLKMLSLSSISKSKLKNNNEFGLEVILWLLQKKNRSCITGTDQHLCLLNRTQFQSPCVWQAHRPVSSLPAGHFSITGVNDSNNVSNNVLTTHRLAYLKRWEWRFFALNPECFYWFIPLFHICWFNL